MFETSGRGPPKLLDMEKFLINRAAPVSTPIVSCSVGQNSARYVFLLVLVLLLAPLLSAQGKSPSKPTVKPTTEDRCKEALHGTGIMRAFVDGNGMQPLVPVRLGGQIEVYIDQRAMDEEMKDSPGFSGNFIGYLFFVFRDEAMRQQAIALLRSHYGPPIQSTCRENYHWKSKLGSGEGVRDAPCLVHTATFENFKYVVMAVYYLRSGISNGSGWIPGPLLGLGATTNVVNSGGWSTYVAPLECVKPNERDLRWGVRSDSGYETISTMGTSALSNDAAFGTQVKTLGNPMVSGSVPIWDLLLGDLGPLEEPHAGDPSVLRITTPQTSFVYQTLEQTEAMMKGNWTRLHPDAQNCSYWHARASNVELEMSYPDVWARCKGQLRDARP
jgi:hypothetical protein